jgi:hypothetical protein
MGSVETRDRFTIRITDRGLEVECVDGGRVALTAAEALMLLDILQNEEQELRKIADDASPLPVRIRF